MRKIKLFAFSAFALMLLFFSPLAMAQSTKELKKEVKSKALKDARKEAKRLKKDGYNVNPGQLPMDKQLEKSWMMAYEFDDKGQKNTLSPMELLWVKHKLPPNCRLMR